VVELEELKQAIYVTDPAAVLVSPRILRRVLQSEFNVPYLIMQAPHERCYFFDRQVLFRHVEQDELELEPDRLLPPTVLLLARPTTEQLQAMSRESLLLTYWQRLFHVHVHLAMHQQQTRGQLNPVALRSRIERIGPTEFEEIRCVLAEENYLLPPMDDARVYIEFAAVYLELRSFRSNLRETYFPAIRDFQAIDEILAQDLDAEALFNKTRLPGAPLPVVRTDPSSDESHDYFRRLMRQSERAQREGDTVRAAILRTRAARVAPAADTQATKLKALEDLARLTHHLQEALKFDVEKSQEWLQVLPALLDKADQGTWPVEAKILYDLQKVCSDHNQRLFALDLVEWVLSAGKRPIKRPLTSLQLVRTTKDLRSAAQRLTMARVPDEDRQRLTVLIQTALSQSEERLRERFRPILHDAFHDVGLIATNPPEQVALQKMTAELLDRIAEYGFFSFSELRDTLSRNQLKLPDLADPHYFWTGDPLLRLDRHLATLMEGVYRKGEFYLRWLESLSSLFFGTGVGRFLTRNVVLPFGGAFVLVKGLEVMLQEYVRGDLYVPGFSTLLLGAFILSLMHWPPLREFFREAGARTYRGARLVIYELPVALWQQPWLQMVLRSWPFLLLYWYMLKPLTLTGLLWLIWPDPFQSPWVFGLAFLVADIVLNSRFGTAVNQACAEALAWFYGWVRFEVLQELFRWVNYFFKQVTSTMEYVLYTVDEWFRFRSGESRLSMVIRGFLGVLWFPIGYLIRAYFIMLAEPTLNPIKLPVSSLAFKCMLPLAWYHDLWGFTAHRERLTPYTGWLLALTLTVTVIMPTVWLLPGIFAFLLWEMQENWRLFRANRSARLKAVTVGRHGETVVQLLKAGFHSGTIPKVYASLRHAESTAYRTNNWRSARTYRQSLREVARSVQLFVDRELIALLRLSKSWPHAPIKIGRIVLSCNRIRIELVNTDYPQEPLWLAFEQRSGWLIGSLPEPGWLAHLEQEPLRVVSSALAGLYKIAGVDLVREQLMAVLAPGTTGYDITDHFLVLWADPYDRQGARYDLRSKRDEVAPYLTNGQPARPGPKLDACRAFFYRVPLTWEQWVLCWEKDFAGMGHPPLFPNGAGPLLFKPFSTPR